MPGPGAQLSLAALFPLAAAAALLAAPARADDLTLTTREFSTWSEALAALRGDLESEGRRVHVGVLAGGSLVPCARYRLQLDEAAAQAFRLGGCDPGTRETLIVLEHRAALFDESSHVPRPRTLSISAALRATAVAGGSAPGGSVVHCSWAVRPYLDDLQHGRRVMLTPEHYALRSAAASFTTTPDGSGWDLHPSSASLDLEYEVTDRATGEVVLHQKTSLRCGAAPIEGEPPAPTPAPAPAPTPAPTPTPVQSQCRWGRSPKGCYANPAANATAFTVLGLSATAGAAVAFYAASRQPGGIGNSWLLGPAALATIGAVSFTAAALATWVDYGHQRAAPVLPAVAVSSRGATLGLGGTF